MVNRGGMSLLILFICFTIGHAAGPCPSALFTYFSASNQCLHMSSTQGNYAQMKQYCENLGPNIALATINNYKEYTDIMTYYATFGAAPSSRYWTWIGYTTASTTTWAKGEWMSIQPGTPSCFSMWSPGQPAPGDELCMHLWDNRGGEPNGGLANDAPCGMDDYGLCQYRPVSAVVPPLFKCASGLYAAGRYCYTYVGEAATYAAAAAMCTGGSTLMFFRCTDDYHDFIKNYWNTVLSAKTAAWVALQRTTAGLKIDYDWKWVPPNERTLFAAWDTAEPSTSTSLNCTSLKQSSDAWQACSCTAGSSQSVICQRDAQLGCNTMPDTVGMLNYGSFLNGITNITTPGTITYNCNVGAYSYIRSDKTQTRSFSCSATNAWNATLEKCEATCPVMSIADTIVVKSYLGDPTITNRYFPFDNVTFTCSNTSYVIDGSVSPVMCLTNGTWSSNPSLTTCKATCAVPTVTLPLQKSGTPSASNTRFLRGQTVTFSCTNTTYFFLDGSATSTCQNDTSWNNVQPVCTGYCQSIAAGSLSSNVVVANYSDSAQRRIGSNATFVCNPATTYAMVGSSSTQCVNFQWTGPFPICNPTCPIPNLSAPLASLDNGTGPGSRFLITTNMTFFCNESLSVLIGPTSAMCLNNGSWDTFPICVGQCPSMQVPKNGDISYEDVQRKINSSARIYCKKDYTLQGASSAVCFTDKTWSLSPDTTPTCKANADPMVKIRTIIQILGCTILMGLTSAVIGIFIVLRDTSTERLIQLCQEVALIGGHILIISARDITEPWEACVSVSTALQYCFLVVFTSCFLEAIHSYTILTNVVSKGGFCRKRTYVILAWLLPLIYTGIVTGLFYNRYTFDHGCWLNWGDKTVTVLSMGPVIGLSCLTIIATEAGGSYRSKALPDVSKSQLYAARVNQNAMWTLLVCHWLSWFLGHYAIYYMEIGWYGSVFIANVSLGVTIFVFHVMGAPKANELVRKHWRKLCCRKPKSAALLNNST